jgi:hypothetical protein
VPTTCNRPASALVLVAADHRKTLDKGIRSVLAHLKTEAERRAATA